MGSDISKAKESISETVDDAITNASAALINQAIEDPIINSFGFSGMFLPFGGNAFKSVVDVAKDLQESNEEAAEEAEKK